MTVPVRGSMASAMLLAAAIVVGCGGTDPGGPDGPAESAPQAATSARVTSDDPQPFTLEPGRYRLNWTTDGCRGLEFVLLGQSGWEYTMASRFARFSAIVSDVPADTFTLSQSNADCPEWAVVLDRIGS